MDIKNAYQHIPETKSIPAIIDSGGLICQTGENCKTDNDTNKAVYFVEGIDGLYKLVSRFLKKIDYENTPQDEMEKESVRGDKAKDSNLMDKMNIVEVDGKSNAYEFLKYIYSNFKNELWDKNMDFGKGDGKYYLELLDRFMERELYKEKVGKNVEIQAMDKGKSLMHECIDLGSNELTDGDLLNVTTALSKQNSKEINKTYEVSKKTEKLL